MRAHIATNKALRVVDVVFDEVFALQQKVHATFPGNEIICAG